MQQNINEGRLLEEGWKWQSKQFRDYEQRSGMHSVIPVGSAPSWWNQFVFLSHQNFLQVSTFQCVTEDQKLADTQACPLYLHFPPSTVAWVCFSLYLYTSPVWEEGPGYQPVSLRLSPCQKFFNRIISYLTELCAHTVGLGTHIHCTLFCTLHDPNINNTLKYCKKNRTVGGIKSCLDKWCQEVVMETLHQVWAHLEFWHSMVCTPTEWLTQDAE